jgi:hypothetical protein
MSRLPLLAAVAAALAVIGGCGGSSGPTNSSGTAAAPTSAAQAGAATAGASLGSPGALQAEANATAAGDIPDNQVFLTFRNSSAGYSIKYPEGWAQQGSGGRVTFRDKNNILRIVVDSGAAPTRASVQADVAGLKGATVRGAPQAMTISGKPAFGVVYSSESAPNPVTGKRVRLVVDRYYLWKTGRRAVIELGAPEGVDNVDAYRMMIESFRWS